MKTIENMRFRRRRLSLTNYKKRLALLKGNVSRVIIRKTNKRIIGQVISYTDKGDMVLVSADSNELKKYNWPPRSNRSTAYLTGMLLAVKASKSDKAKHLTGIILDTGLASPVKNSIPFVFAKGCIDGGLKLNANIEIKEDVYNYSKLDYVQNMMQNDNAKYSKQFGSYINKDKVTPEKLHELFENAKSQIMKSG